MDELELEYADHRFADCEVAIECLCIGCPDERGWSFATDQEPQGDVCCEYMVNDVTDCQHPIVMELDGGGFLLSALHQVRQART